MKTLRNFVLSIMLAIGLLGFGLLLICNGLSAIGVRLVSTTFQFPAAFEYPQNLMVDGIGRIYCFTRSLQRLQIYDNEGEFLIGWFVKSPHVIAVEQDSGQITITDFKDTQIVYDIDGNVINETTVSKGTYEQMRSLDRDNRRHQDSYGNIYQSSPTIVNPYVVKVTPKGSEKKIVLREPFYLWPFRWFFPGSIFLLLPPVTWAILGAIKKRKREILEIKGTVILFNSA